MSPREAFPPAPEGDNFSLNSIEETGIEAEEDTRTISSTSSSSSEWLKDELRTFLIDIADALQTPKNDLPDSSQTESLSVLSLQKDLKRCYSLLHPALEVAVAFYDILMWKDAFSTLLFALVFFYSVYRQWTATLILLLLTLQFGLNYLATKKGIKIGLYFLPRKNLPKPSFNLSGAQLVIEVAKIVQYLLRFSVDVLEKIHSLFTWKEERVTLRFCYLLAYWLGWALLFDLGTCVSWCLAALGVRLFFTTYLFERFPLLRNNLDTYGYFYRNLPVKNQPPSPDTSYADLTSLSSSSSSISSQQSTKSTSRFRLWAQSKLRRSVQKGFRMQNVQNLQGLNSHGLLSPLNNFTDISSY